MEAAMFTYLILLALLVLGLCYLEGDFAEGGLFATLLKRLARR